MHVVGGRRVVLEEAVIQPITAVNSTGLEPLIRIFFLNGKEKFAVSSDSFCSSVRCLFRHGFPTFLLAFFSTLPCSIPANDQRNLRSLRRSKGKGRINIRAQPHSEV